MDTTDLRESATDAIRFWEPRRLIYNAVLARISPTAPPTWPIFLLKYPAIANSGGNIAGSCF
jgi:hypothetical protein